MVPVSCGVSGVRLDLSYWTHYLDSIPGALQGLDQNDWKVTCSIHSPVKSQFYSADWFCPILTETETTETTETTVPSGKRLH